MTNHTTRIWFYGCILTWQIFFFFVELSSAHIPALIVDIVGVFTLLLLPGFLTLLILRLDKLIPWGLLVIIVGFSLLELMLVALAGNYLLPYYGYAQPLAKPVLLSEFFILFNMLLLGVVVMPTMSTLSHLCEGFSHFFRSRRDVIVAFIPALFPLLAVMGSTILNNGGSGMVTLCMLGGIVIYTGYLISKSHTLSDNVIPTSLFFISLALLFMTSLRGSYITGHDIQREYLVFQLAKTNNIWSIATYRDAYNACMSITILPTIFSAVMRIFDPFVYKVIFQIIFALVPSIIYMTIRRYVAPAIACISTFYFIAFPTFFGDMPFLNRQEIALLYFSLMIYTLFESATPLVMRQIIFVLFGVGMIISHYSTTYMVLALLFFLICSRWIFSWLGARLSRVSLFKDSGVAFLRQEGLPEERTVTMLVVVILTTLTFLWGSILTNTASDSIVRVLNDTIATIKNNVAEDSRSNDVGYSLFPPHTLNDEQLLQQYNQSIAGVRTQSPTGMYYASSTYAQYPIHLANDSSMRITRVGIALRDIGVDVVGFNKAVRDWSAKILQMLVIVGFCATTFSSAFLLRKLDTEFVILSVGSILFLLAQIVLPVLSSEYGLLRVFQQALIFLGLLIGVGSAHLCGLVNRRVQIGGAAVIAILFLASSTGMITQILGGYGPQLHLNNAGSYYDMYYIHTDEVDAMRWMQQTIDETHADIQMDVRNNPYLSTPLRGITDYNPLNGIYPLSIRRDAYVYIQYAVAHTGEATLIYNGTRLTYVYPIMFLDDNKDLIYNNGFVRIYR